MTTTNLEHIKFPELVFGIAGPVGVDTDLITSAICDALIAVNYSSIPIKLTTELYGSTGESPPAPTIDYHSSISTKIAYANKQRADKQDQALLARVAIRSILRERLKYAKAEGTIPQQVAYIINQLKRPEEVELLRRVYGRQFILVSAYGSVDDRRSAIIRKIKSHGDTSLKDHQLTALSDELIATDAEELSIYGQNLRETFHLGDVFVDGIQRGVMERNVTRFVEALFGRTDLSPSKQEYGMYAAKSAALRSVDLSRQVGAAIFSDDGELITQGCNEAPKAFGGTYWDMETPDYRDVVIGRDPNESLKSDIIRDLVDRLSRAGLLSRKAKGIGNSVQIAAAISAKPKLKDGTEIPGGALAGAMIMDLTEYGRIVHAEMCAICDAARLGKSIKGATLFCTTFPCHNCTKHILASGIRRVVYMEPYPKSKAKELHENEIEIEQETDARVSFMPFLGISPYRYRDIFQKGKRKDAGGQAKRWLSGEPAPMVPVILETHVELELWALAKDLVVLTPNEVPGQADPT